MPARHTPEKFWAKIDRRGPDDCWPWLGQRAHNGYGSVCYQRRNARAHRIAYELGKGEIPPGLQIDHMCRNKVCCNPAHLRAVTHRVNSTENSNTVSADALRVTHCPRGHEYDEANTKLYRGMRYCLACQHAKRKRSSPLTLPQQHALETANAHPQGLSAWPSDRPTAGPWCKLHEGLVAKGALEVVEPKRSYRITAAGRALVASSIHETDTQ